jgi:hypothetical protein
MRLAFLIALILFFPSGCSKTAKNSAVETEATARPPIEIDLPQAFTRDGELFVRASIRPLVNLKSDDVSVGIVGLSDGLVKREEHRALRSLSGKETVSAGETLLADFTLPSEGLTEYQVVLRWGEDAKLARASLSEVVPHESSPTKVENPKSDSIPLAPEVKEVTLIGLALRRTPLENCQTPPCDEACMFEGEVVNGTTKIASRLTLALGVTFVPKGSKIDHPKAGDPLRADEQEIPLSGVELQPGGRRKIEVKLSEPIAEIPEGSFVPYLRLLSTDVVPSR